MTTPDPVSAERLAALKNEFGELAASLAETDGPGAVSAFYTSLSAAEVVALLSAEDRAAQLLKERDEANGEVVRTTSAAINAHGETVADLIVAQTALQSSQALLSECERALTGVIAVADRKTDEFDAAKVVLAKLKERKP